MSQQRIDTARIFPARMTLEGVEVGLELEPKVFGPISRQDIVRYAGASGDFNPIHIDEGYARATGAPTVFAMGMLPGGFLATAVAHWFGGPQTLRRLKFRFTTRVWPGDEVVCTGKVVAIEDGLVKISISASRRGDGPAELNLDHEQTAIVGEADLELPTDQ